MEEKPAPRPMETHRRLAPEYMPLEEDGLQVNLGSIPGKKRRILEEDNLISGRGCIP